MASGFQIKAQIGFVIEHLLLNPHNNHNKSLIEFGSATAAQGQPENSPTFMTGHIIMLIYKPRRTIQTNTKQHPS